MKCPICKLKQFFQNAALRKEIRARKKIYDKAWKLTLIFLTLEEDEESSIHKILNYCDKKITEAKQALGDSIKGSK